MNNTSKTNWERVDSLTDDQIDTTEMPPLTEDFFARARWRQPTPVSVEPSVTILLHLSPEILTWFQAQGEDYERRMSDVLRQYTEAQSVSV